MGGLAGGLRSYIAGDGPAGIIGNAIIGAGFGAAGAALIAANPALAPYLFGVGSGLTGRQVAVDIQQGRWDLAAYDMALFAAALGTYKYSPALKSARPRRQLYAGGPRRTTPTSELKAQLRAVVDEDPAYYDYFEHGNQDGFVHVADDGITRTPISVAEVAAQIKADPNWGGRPVRVFACDAGIRSDGPAKQLASLLGVQTHAPPGKVAFAWKPWYITDDPANGTDMGQALVPFDP